jgi:thiosulfate dehydrogenase [quinone] large subunit
MSYRRMADRCLAHSLGQVALGLNIALHGLVRLPHIAAFSHELRGKFAGTVLPGELVEASGYGIVIAEAVIGLLLSGLWQRCVLTAGVLLMMVLEFGACLQQKWANAGSQFIYVGFYAVLLATLPERVAQQTLRVTVSP